MIYIISMCSIVYSQIPAQVVPLADIIIFQDNLSYQEQANVKRATRSVFNSTSSSPSGQYMVSVLESTFYINSSVKSCSFVVNVSFLDYRIGQKYIGIYSQPLVTQNYNVLVYTLNTCVLYKQITYLVSTTNLTNLTTSNFNTTGCKGDFSIFDDSTKYEFAFSYSCPQAIQYNISLTNGNVTVTTKQTGLIFVGQIAKITGLQINQIYFSYDMVKSQHAVLTSSYLLSSLDHSIIYANLEAVSGTFVMSVILTTSITFGAFAQGHYDSFYVTCSIGSALPSLYLFKLQNGVIIPLVTYPYFGEILNFYNASSQQIFFTSETDKYYILQQSSTQKITLNNVQHTVATWQVSTVISIPILAQSIPQALFQPDNTKVALNVLKQPANRHFALYNDLVYIMNCFDLVLFFSVVQQRDLTFVADTFQVTGSEKAGGSAILSFNTLTNCEDFHVHFDTSGPITLNYNKTNLSCAAQITLPTRSKLYNIQLSNYGYNQFKVGTYTVIPNDMATVLQISVQPQILRINNSFTVKITVGDRFENSMQPSLSQCSGIIAIIRNDTSNTSAINSSSTNQTTNQTIVNSTFALVAGYCIAKFQPMSRGSYILLLDSQQNLSYSSVVQQQMTFRVANYPFEYRFNTQKVVHMIGFSIFLLFISIGLPLILYFLVNGKAQPKKSQLKQSQSPLLKADSKLAIETTVTEMKEPKVHGSFEKETIRGLGEIQIRGRPLFVENIVGSMAFRFNKQQLNVFTQLKEQIQTNIQSGQHHEIISSVEFNGQIVCLIISLFQNSNNYAKQLQLWQKLKLNSKLRIIQVTEYSKSDACKAMPLLQQFNFEHCVIIITENIQPFHKNQEVSSNIQDDIIYMQQLQPPRRYGDVQKGIVQTTTGEQRLLPPKWFGDDYLLRGTQNLE